MAIALMNGENVSCSIEVNVIRVQQIPPNQGYVANVFDRAAVHSEHEMPIPIELQADFVGDGGCGATADWNSENGGVSELMRV